MKRETKLIYSKNLASVNYAYASCIPADKELLFMAGACPIDGSGKVIHFKDYALQTKHCIDNLKTALSECNASLKDVVYIRVLAATNDRMDLVTVWDMIKNEFNENEVPATLLGVTVLGYEDQVVEIEAIAAIETYAIDNN